MFRYKCDHCGLTIEAINNLNGCDCPACRDGTLGLDTRPESDDYALWCELYLGEETDDIERALGQDEDD
jgi:hypothetical protein